MTEEVAVLLRLKFWSQNHLSERLQTVGTKYLNICVMARIPTVYIYFSQFFPNNNLGKIEKKISKVSFNC